MRTTNTNLMYAEAQINKYLHEHTTDASDVLWVTNEGVRLPYGRSYDALPRNMDYLEAQLEKYLHEHETSAGGGTTSLFAESDIENSNGQGPAGNEIPFFRVLAGELKYFWPSVDYTTPQSVNPADYNFMVQGSVTLLRHYVVSSANPDTGTFHLRSEDVDADANANIYIGDKLTGADTQAGPVGFDISPHDGASMTLSARVAHTGSASLSDERVQLIVQTYDANGDGRNFFQNQTFIPTLNDGTYETFSIDFDLTGYTSGHVMFTPIVAHFHDAAEETFPRVDVDNIVLSKDGGATTLFTTDVGFRFPYDWEEKGAVEQNMHYLETQISQYLHSHEEGVA